MRIAVVSDIHGNLAALEAVVADFRHRGIDQIVNLGDSLAGPLLPRETAQFLMAQDWIHIAGNHERQMLKLQDNSNASDTYARSQLGPAELDWLTSLPVTATIDGQVLLCHGTPTSDVTSLLEVGDRAASRSEIETRLGEVEAAVILCGHTHVARSVRFGSRLIVNPGSVGLPAFFDDHPFPHAIESGSPDARYAIVEQTGDTWTAALMMVPYANRQMMELARLRGRIDWVRALSTGYMS
jgi:putative phosphoesterase